VAIDRFDLLLMEHDLRIRQFVPSTHGTARMEPEPIILYIRGTA
jgi:hypothetical protein